MKVLDNLITADSGKILIRTLDDMVMGDTHHMGVLYYVHGNPICPPVKETPEDFIEVSVDELEILQRQKYVSIVEKLIREKYSVSDELAIQRQRDTKPDAFREYFDFCEDCKRRAREELGI